MHLVHLFVCMVSDVRVGRIILQSQPAPRLGGSNGELDISIAGPPAYKIKSAAFFQWARQ